MANYTRNDVINLRGQPVMFYYVILALTALAFVMCHALLRSRVGYYWQAIREDELAARSLGINTFRYKMIAIVISSGMTAPAGVFYAFYYNNLFPEQTFFILRSIEIILGPIIGGVGTLFGPVIGAFLLTGLSEALQELLTAYGLDTPGAKRVFYGVCLLLVVMVLPHGIWPPIARLLAPRPARNAGGVTWPRCWRSTNVSKNFSGLRAVADVSFAVPEGAIFAVIGPNGAGKTTLFNLIAGVIAPDAGRIAFQGARIDRLPPDEVCRRGIGRTFQIVRPFPALSVEDNVAVGALLRHPTRRRRCAARIEVLWRLDLFDKRRHLAGALTLARPQAAGGRARARDRAEAPAARRGDGGAAADRDRPHGRYPEEAQPRERADHPADRARHARGDVGRDPRAGAASRRRHRRGHARAGGARARGGAVLSRRGGGVMLTVENLEVSYGDVRALDGVSLEVAEGAIVAIVGANGAGKTTLIRTIAGMLRPARGRIMLRDISIGGLESHRVCNLGIGQVAEGRQVFPTLTVLENLEMGAMLPRARAEQAQNLERVFALFPRLAERAGQAAGTLSGGEQQMLAIGRCLMGKPDLVMFDEPSLGLAPTIVQAMLQTIRDLNRDGLTCVLVEQNVAVSLKLASRAYVLENGRVTLSGTGEELLADDRVRQAYLGM